MRRDPRSSDRLAPARRLRSPDELLAAYVDGVSELAPGERRELASRLASDDALRAEAAATRDLLGKLRELPPDAGEPDWAALERSIGDAVGPEVPRAWWRRFGRRWIVPGVTLAAGAAIAALVMRAPEQGPAPETAIDAGGRAATVVAPAPRTEDTMALWLDGEEVEVGLAAEELLEVPWEGDLNEADLLPASDLAWIDALDGEALDRAEAWLDQPAPAPPGRRKRS